MTNECIYILLYFFILFFISRLIHRAYKKDPRTQTADGSIVMAVGIFSFDALPRIPFIPDAIKQFIILELLVIFLYLVMSYLKQYRDGYFRRSIQLKKNQFGLGTWVAGSSLLAVLLLQTIHCFPFVAWGCAFIAVLIWLVYVPCSCINLARLFIKLEQVNIGIILLPTVSTQAIALLCYSLCSTLPLLLYQTLIPLGYILYLPGFFIIARYLFSLSCRRIILSWSSTNSILHGALSISGLAATTTAALNDTLIIGTWLIATSLLFLVEGIALLKSVYRFKAAGFMRGLFVYDVAQWARVFTFGMYYTFNLNLMTHHIYVNGLIRMVIEYGQYGVLALLLFEMINYLWHQFKCRYCL
ncbi:hypothetical protein [Legionella rowbothamii]|uniref:hypothetical protein n=1 Tax=Legionella rowbothamii TaxID=96229 RepID=UPI00105479AB|nr:hypothetical protein [Legionella rowbothamii]